MLRTREGLDHRPLDATLIPSIPRSDFPGKWLALGIVLRCGHFGHGNEMGSCVWLEEKLISGSYQFERLIEFVACSSSFLQRLIKLFTTPADLVLCTSELHFVCVQHMQTLTRPWSGWVTWNGFRCNEGKKSREDENFKETGSEQRMHAHASPQWYICGTLEDTRVYTRVRERSCEAAHIWEKQNHARSRVMPFSRKPKWPFLWTSDQIKS